MSYQLLEAIADFIMKYWFLLLSIFGVLWQLIKFLVNHYMKPTIAQIKATAEQLRGVKIQLDDHDKADKLIELRLTGLIAENKEAARLQNEQVQNRLDSVITSIAVANNNIEWLVAAKGGKSG